MDVGSPPPPAAAVVPACDGVYFYCERGAFQRGSCADGRVLMDLIDKYGPSYFMRFDALKIKSRKSQYVIHGLKRGKIWLLQKGLKNEKYKLKFQITGTD